LNTHTTTSFFDNVIDDLVYTLSQEMSVKVSCNDHKYDILSKSSSLNGWGIFINENLIPQKQTKLKMIIINRNFKHINKILKNSK